MRLTSADVARWVALHGPLLSTGADAARLPLPYAALSLALAVAPALGYAVFGERTRIGAALPYAVVPAGWGLGIAVIDVGLGAEPGDGVARGLRQLVGLVVYLVAIHVATPAAAELPVRPAGERPTRPDSSRRATMRAVLIVLTAATTIGATGAATVAVLGATPAERTFAVVIAGTVGLTLSLAALPVALRSERHAPAHRVSGFAWLALSAILALASAWVR